MGENDDLQLARFDVFKLPPEKVLELFTNELRHPLASMIGCIELLEKIVLPNTTSSKPTLERVIQIIQGNIDRIETIRQDNYLYLEKRNK